MADRIELKQKMAAGANCAQTVFGAFADRFDYAEEEFTKIAAGFGGGMFRGDTCGAVTGGIMALGAAFGDDSDKMHEKVKAFQTQFAEKHGSTICRELMGYDFSIPGEREKALASGAKDRCPEYVADAVEMIEKLLDE